MIFIPFLLFNNVIVKYSNIKGNKLGKYPQFSLKRKKKAWVAQLCYAQETGKPDGRLGRFGLDLADGSRPFIKKPRLLKSCFCHVDGSFNIPLSLYGAGRCILSIGFILMRSRHFFLIVFLVCKETVFLYCRQDRNPIS